MIGDCLLMSSSKNLRPAIGFFDDSRLEDGVEACITIGMRRAVDGLQIRCGWSLLRSKE
jgi:hypothetical protein